MEYIKCQFLLRELAVVVVVDHPHGEAISSLWTCSLRKEQFLSIAVLEGNR